MNSLFGFHEKLEVVENDVPKLAQDATDVHKTAHKEAKKKECKTVYCIQSTVDLTNFDKIFHVESTKVA